MNVYSEIVEKMGGDPQGKDYTEKECLAELTSLSERDFLCGAYWAIKNISDNEQLLNQLSITPDRESFLQVLYEYTSVLISGPPKIGMGTVLLFSENDKATLESILDKYQDRLVYWKEIPGGFICNQTFVDNLHKAGFPHD